MRDETFEEILRTVRRFISERVMPREQEIEDRDLVPTEIRRGAAELGLFGYALPEEHGGLGLGMAQDVRLAFEFGYTVPAFRSLFGTNNGIAGQMIARFGTGEQRAALLPGLASGETIASFALTEAEAGSDPSGLRTSAREDGAGYVLNGQKRFITNAPLADLFVVFARTDPAAPAGKGITAFLVDASTPGVRVGPRDSKMGQSGAWTSEVLFEDVRVDSSTVLGAEPGGAYGKALSVLSRGRLHIAALCVGLARRALEESVAYAASSKQGGRPIGEHQLVKALLAETHAELLAGRSLVLDAARGYESGEDTSVGPSSAKLFCSEMACRACDRAVQVHGGVGYMRGTVVERCYRDARLYRIYEGTSEIQKLIIGGALLRAAG